MSLIFAQTVAYAAQIALQTLLGNEIMADDVVSGQDISLLSCVLRQGEAEARVAGPDGEIAVIVGQLCGCGGSAFTIEAHANLDQRRLTKAVLGQVKNALEGPLQRYGKPLELLVIVKAE